jgi:DNA-binding MarR family transcriptional regulator
MSSLVEGLRKRGLMEMKRSPVDRRRQVWQLLTQGEDLLEQIRHNLGSIAQQIDSLVPRKNRGSNKFLLVSEPSPRGAPFAPLIPTPCPPWARRASEFQQTPWLRGSCRFGTTTRNILRRLLRPIIAGRRMRRFSR